MKTELFAVDAHENDSFDGDYTGDLDFLDPDKENEEEEKDNSEIGTNTNKKIFAYSDKGWYRYFDKIMKKYPRLNKHEFESLRTDPNKVNKLVVHNLRLVSKIASYYKGHGLDDEDLVSEGVIGLINASKRYDFSSAFSTYATYWIRQAITRAIKDNSKTVRIPLHAGERLRRFIKEKDTLTQIIGREPTSDDVKKYTGVDDEFLKTMESVASISYLVSLEQRIGEDTDTTLGDMIGDQSISQADDVLETKKKKEDINKVLDTFSPRYRYVVKMFYDIYASMGYKNAMKEIKQVPNLIRVCACEKDENGKLIPGIPGCVFRRTDKHPSEIRGCLFQKRNTLDDIGKTLGLTRERIRQILAKSLKMLRHPAKSKVLLKHYYSE